MGLRSIFSIRTCPYFWCFRHLMGGASNPAYRVFNRKISTSPSVHSTKYTHSRFTISFGWIFMNSKIIIMLVKRVLLYVVLLIRRGGWWFTLAQSQHAGVMGYTINPNWECLLQHPFGGLLRYRYRQNKQQQSATHWDTFCVLREKIQIWRGIFSIPSISIFKGIFAEGEPLFPLILHA